jgi:hypothetical protein
METVIESLQDIELLRQLDCQRARNYTQTQLPMTPEEWLKQIQLFEQSGLENAASDSALDVPSNMRATTQN